MTSTFSDTEEPSSPDPPGWGANYTPTKDDPEFVEFHGRRRARILNGQDPQKNPEKFTPLAGGQPPRVQVAIRPRGEGVGKGYLPPEQEGEEAAAAGGDAGGERRQLHL